VIARAALATLGAGATPAIPGFDVELEARPAGDQARAPASPRSLSGRARVVNQRTGLADEADFLAEATADGELEVQVGKTRLRPADLDDEARAALVIARLPELVDRAASARDLDLARRILAAVREFPPDGASADGLARRAQLVRLIVAWLAPEHGALGAGAVRVVGELIAAADLAPGTPARRGIEEMLWARSQAGGATGAPLALRPLAEALGFAPAVLDGRESASTTASTTDPTAGTRELPEDEVQ
jgi:hypothetical protein